MDNSGAEAVLLDGSGSHDSDGAITGHTWTEGASVLAQGSKTTVSLAVGIHEITLTVTDDRGATGTDTVRVTVGRGTDSEPPQATIGTVILRGRASPNTVSVLVEGKEVLDPDRRTWVASVDVPPSGKTVEAVVTSENGSAQIKRIRIQSGESHSSG